MSEPHIDALRISPLFSSRDWFKLRRNEPGDWRAAVEILRDRIEGRFLSYADACISSQYSGFVVLAIDSLLLETLQQFRDGTIHSKRKSKKFVMRFLEGARFQPQFDEDAREAYSDIRCGLLHQGEAKRMWLIRRGQDSILKISPNRDGYVIDVRMFHKALKDSFDDYLKELVAPSNDRLRTNLWRKMDHICNIREERGAVYAVEVGGPAKEGV